MIRNCVCNKFVTVHLLTGNCWRQLPLEEKKIWESRAKKAKAEHKKMAFNGIPVTVYSLFSHFLLFADITQKDNIHDYHLMVQQLLGLSGPLLAGTIDEE